MPVHSKPFAGRAKNAPPLLGPKPYQKPPQNGPHSTWVTPNSPVLKSFTNGPTNNDEESQNLSSVQFSVLRRPAEKKPDKVPKSPQVVRFGAAEIFGGKGDEEEVARKRKLNQPDVVGECSSATSNQTTKLPTSASGLSGAQALKECEEHTDWANEVLTRHNLPLISDLRKSIGDGFTLPTILEIIGGVSLSCVKTCPTTKEERVSNILHCLKFLCRRGVNVTGIEPSEIEDGHLKSVLLLVGNIRQHFKNTYRPEQNGFAHPVPDSPEITNKSPVELNMPGTMKLPGAVPTPFVPQGSRNNIPEPASRKSGYHEEEILPGVLGRDVNSNDTHKPHFNIISTTEIGTNGVAQHGVDERKHHFANNNNSTANRGMVIRHPNARTGAPNMHEQPTIPPSVTQRAWTGSPRPAHNNVNGASMSPSVEDRLKNLLGSSSSRSNSRDNLGYFGGGFHGGSSEILDDDDGEILVVPQPMSRNSSDFEAAMLGDHGYGPGYRPITSQHTRQRSQQGYVPSKPSERVQGSRAEVIISRPPSAIAFRKSAPTKAVPQSVPGSAPGNSHDNSPFSHGSPSPSNYGNRGGNQQVGETVNKHPSPIKARSNDLRNAWHKLYGPQAQVPPYGGSSIQRGDQLRSSYGHQSPQRQTNNVGQHSVTFAPPTSQMSNRPVSAPAPAHMQAYFHAQDQHIQGQGQSQSQENIDHQGQSHSYTSHQRESPMGQSSSTQGHLDESSSSQQSRLSQEQAPKNLQVQTSTDNNYGKLSQSSHSSLSQPSPNSPGSPDYAIGPASKYPDNPGSRPSSARKPPGPTIPASPSHRQNRPRLPLPHQLNENVNRNDLRHSNQHRNNFSEDLTSALQAASKDHKNAGGYSFDDSHDRSHDQSHDLSFDFQNRSIFDFNPPSRSESTGSVTPPLPPLSPTNTPPDSPQMDLNSNLPRSLSATNVSSAAGRIDEADGKMLPKRKPRRASEINYRMERQSRGKKTKNRGFRTRGAGLNDVRESGTDTESNLSFDIDDTILTVESHDTEQPHPAGVILSSPEVTTLRDQLHNLEFKYNDLQNKVSTERPVGHRLHQHMSAGKGQGFGPPPIGRQRRWSIGSSDTSSFRREAKFKPGKQIHHKHHSKEFKNINKRFQRLESHVVTLARSVAHLSSELRTHNTMVNDLEAVKRELRELRDNPSRPFPNMIDRTMAEQEKFRDWVPSLTNPKRVNKLTKFFGSEPPLLELFLEKLGYKKYVSNFKSEHIGMIELPYMTEDRLEKIGVPMGPRIRILQEAQSCFRHENMNIYLV